MSTTDGTASTDPKALVRRFYAELDAGNPGVFSELLAEDFEAHLAGLPTMDRDGLAAFGAGFAASFPDLHHRIEDQVAEGDRVASRLSFRGTHEGDFQGIPATGVEIEATAINLHRVDRGRIVEQWAVLDMASVLRQLHATA